MESMTLNAIERRHGILWRFNTARYTIAFWAEDEDLDPADSFQFEDDIAFAREDDPAHWFCGFVGVFERDEYDDGECVGYDVLGCCSYHSFREFYSMHRWQYSRRQGKYIEDPKSRAWKACERLRPRRDDGSRADGSYFPQMVRQAVQEARNTIALRSEGARHFVMLLNCRVTQKQQRAATSSIPLQMRLETMTRHQLRDAYGKAYRALCRWSRTPQSATPEDWLFAIELWNCCLLATLIGIAACGL